MIGSGQIVTMRMGGSVGLHAEVDVLMYGVRRWEVHRPERRQLRDSVEDVISCA